MNIKDLKQYNDSSNKELSSKGTINVKDLKNLQGSKTGIFVDQPIGDYFKPYGGVKDIDKRLGYKDLEDVPEGRAKAQTGWELTGKFATQLAGEAIIGMPEAMGYGLDFEDLQDHEKESRTGFDNEFSKYFREAKNRFHENNEIFQSKAAQEGDFWERLGDPTWRASQGRTIGTTISLMAPSLLAAGLISTGVGAAGGAVLAANIAGGMGAAMFSRKAESAMESQGTFEQEYNRYMNEDKTDEEARKLAGQAAATVHKANAAMLPLDMLQYITMTKALAPMAKVMNGVKASKAGNILTNAVFQPGSEALEEGYQFVAQEEAIAGVREGITPFGEGFGDRLTDYMADPEFQTSAFMGAVTGGIFGAIGPINTKVKNKIEKYTALKAVSANLADQESFDKIDKKIEGDLLMKAANTNTLDRLSNEFTVYNDKIQNDESKDESKDEATKKAVQEKTDKIVENANYIKIKDEELKTINPEYAKHPTARAKYALLNYENKFNNEEIDRLQGEVSKLSPISFKDTKDVAVKTKIELGNLMMSRNRLESDRSLDKAVRQSMINDVSKKIEDKQSELTGMLENLPEDFNPDKYGVEGANTYAIKDAILQNKKIAKDIYAEQIATYTEKSKEAIAKEDAEFKKQATENLKNQQKETVKKTVKEVKTVEEVNKVKKETKGTAFETVAKKEVKEQTFHQNPPNYISNDKPTNKVNVKVDSKTTNTELEIKKVDVEKRREKEIAEKGLTHVEHNPFPDENDVDKFNEINAKYDAELAELTEKEETLEQPIKKERPLLPKYDEKSPHIESTDIEEVKALLNKVFAKEAESDVKLEMNLEVLDSMNTGKAVNSVLSSIYNTQYADKLSTIMNDYLVNKQSNVLEEVVGSIYDGPNQAGIIEEDLSDESIENLGYLGSIFEFAHNPATGKFTTEPASYIMEDPDFNQEYVSNPEHASENTKVKITFEVYGTKSGIETLNDENGVSNTQIMGVFYSKDGKRHPVTMLGNKQQKLTDAEYADLLALREEVVSGAREFFKDPNNKNKPYNSKIETTATKQKGKIIRTKNFIPVNEVVALPKIGKKKRLLFGIVRFTREEGVYLSSPGTPSEMVKSHVSQNSKLGSTMMWVEAANGQAIPIRVMTKSFNRMKSESKLKAKYNKELAEIRELLLSVNKDNVKDIIKKINTSYFNTYVQVRKDKKGNIKTISFTKKRLADAIDSIVKSKTPTDRQTNYTYAQNVFNLSTAELDAILSGDKSVIAKNASTKNLTYAFNVGETDVNNPNSVNSNEFEMFLGDLQHQIDVSQINKGQYNRSVYNLLTVNIPADRVTHSPIYNISKDVKRPNGVASEVKNLSKETPTSDIKNNEEPTLFDDEGTLVNETDDKEETVNSDVNEDITEDVLDLLGIKRRKGEASEVKKTWTKEELAWVKSVLPIDMPDGVKLQIVDSIINIGGENSMGTFQEDLIKVWRGAEEGTIYHEAFHAVFNMALNPGQRRTLMLEAAGKYKIPLSDIVALEEELAEDFMRYVQSMSYSGKSLPRRILAFFNRLSTFMKNGLIKSNSINSIYYHINKGDYKNAEFLKANNIQRNKRFSTLNYVQEKLRVDAISHTMSDIVDKLMINNQELSRAETILNYGFDKLLLDTFEELKAKVAEQQAVTPLSGAQIVQFNAMAQGIFEFDKVDGKIAIPKNPTKNLKLLGEKALGIFSDIEKIDIKLKSVQANGISPVTAEEVTEMNEEINGREHWMISATEESKRDKVRGEVKSVLARIPELDKDGNIAKDDLGFIRYLDYNKAFATLLRELSDSISSEDMLANFKEIVDTNPEFKNLLDKINSDELLKTKFWISIQNSHADYRLLRQDYHPEDKKLKPNKRRFVYQWMSANRQSITQHIMNTWRDNVNSPILSKVQKDKDTLLTGEENHPLDNKKFKEKSDKELELLKDNYSKKYYKNPKSFMRILEYTGLDVTLEELEILKEQKYETSRGERNRYVDFIDTMKAPLRTMLQGNDPSKTESKSFKRAARQISKIRYDYMESSFRGGDNKTRYSHIMISYVAKMMSQLKHEDNFDLSDIEEGSVVDNLLQIPGYSNINWLTDLADPNIRDNFKFALFDSIRYKGEPKGKTYSNISPTSLNTVRLNAFYNNGSKDFAYYMVPVLSDTPTNMYVQAKRLSKEEAVEASINSLLAEWDLVKNADKAEGVTNLERRIDNLVMFEKIDNETTRKLLEKHDAAIDKKAVRKELFPIVQSYLEQNYTDVLAELVDQEVVKYDEETKEYSSKLIHSDILDNNNTSEFKLDKYTSIEDYVREYAYNNTVSKANMTMLFLGTPGAYKNTEDIYKRLKQIWAPGTRLDTSAKYTLTEEQMKEEGVGNPVVETGKNYTGIMIKDIEIESQISEDILNLHLSLGKGDEAYSIAAKFGYTNYTDKKGTKWAKPPNSKYKFRSNKNSLTDGQSFISPRRKRKIDIGLGKWNNEKQNDFANMINGEASEVVHNPLKGFVFGFRDINGLRVPYQFKNSEAMLNPALSFAKVVNGKKIIALPTVADREDGYSTYASPTLAKMLDLMERYSYNDSAYMDVIHFDSAVKVGQYKVNTLDNIENSEVQEFSNEDYMLMQEVSDHFTDDVGNFGSQIRKLIIADIGDAVEFYNAEFGTLPKDEIVKLYQNLISTDVNVSFEEIDEMFIKDTDSIKDQNKKISKLSNKLIKEARERKLGDEAIFALGTKLDSEGILRFNIPLFDPIHASRTQNLIGSLYKNNVVKQKINGGNIVQASSIGFQDELKINYKDGAIESFDAYLPWWSEQKIKNLVDPKTGFVDVNDITDKSILDIIGYRIPTEDKYSMMPMRVKGFLPRSAGGVIILPTEITTLSGADFDIDKLFLMIPNFEVKDGVLNKIKYDYNKPPREQSKEARDNAKIDIIWSILTNKDTAGKQMDPGNFDYLSSLAKAIKVKRGYSATLDLLNPTTETKMFEAAMAANGLIGVFANQNVNHSIFQHGDVKLAKPVIFGKDNEGNPNYYRELSAVSSSEKMDLSRADDAFKELVKDDPTRISRKLSMMLSAIVDDLKHMNSGPLNINFFTADIISLMMRLGMNMVTSVSLVNQPAVIRLNEVFEKNGGNFDVFEDSLNQVISEIEENADIKGSTLSSEDLNVNVLWDNIGKDLKTDKSEKFAQEQIEALKLFEVLRDNALDLGKGIRAFKTDDINRKITLESNEVFESTKNKFLESKTFTGHDALWDNYEMLKAFYDTAVVGANKSLNKLYIYNSPAFRKIKDKISDNLTGQKELDETNIMNVNFTLMDALISGYSFFNGKETVTKKGKDISEKEDLLKNFPGEFEQFKRKNKKFVSDHVILHNLEIKNKDNYIPIPRITHSNTGTLNEQDKAKLADSWIGLINYRDDANPTRQAEIQELGKKLVKYTYHAYGFGMSPNAFSQYMPLEWRVGLEVEGEFYTDFLYKLFSEANNKDFGQNLYRQFKQHYAANKFFVERVEITPDNMEKMEKAGAITISNGQVTKLTLSSAWNSKHAVKKHHQIKSDVIFPDMISIDYKDKILLLEAVAHNPEGYVKFQEYRITSTLGVKGFATEYDIDSTIKTSIYDFNNPKLDGSVIEDVTFTEVKETLTDEEAYANAFQSMDASDLAEVEAEMKANDSVDIGEASGFEALSEEDIDELKELSSNVESVNEDSILEANIESISSAFKAGEISDDIIKEYNIENINQIENLTFEESNEIIKKVCK